MVESGLPDPDPLVRGTDLDPSIMKQKYYEKPEFLLLCDFLLTFYLLKNDVYVTLKSNKPKKNLLAFRRPLTKRAGSVSGSVRQKYGSEDPDPYQWHGSGTPVAGAFTIAFGSPLIICSMTTVVIEMTMTMPAKVTSVVMFSFRIIPIMQASTIWIFPEAMTLGLRCLHWWLSFLSRWILCDD